MKWISENNHAYKSVVQHVIKVSVMENNDVAEANAILLNILGSFVFINGSEFLDMHLDCIRAFGFSRDRRTYHQK